MRYAEKMMDICRRVSYVWAREMKTVVKDEGVLIFFVLVPLVYPLLYSWIYNNEVVRDVPVVVVDDSHGQMSRRLVRMLDATSDVKVMGYAADMEEARNMMAHQDAFGIVHIPSDFERRIYRREQSTVSVYCDMSLLLTYKAIYTSVMAVTSDMASEMAGRKGADVSLREVAMFNPTSGYGSFIIPAVLMLIIQQTLALGIGMIAGTQRERQRPSETNKSFGAGVLVVGKSLCYFMIYAVVAAYLVCVVPGLFSFVSLSHASALTALFVPYILACIFFAMTVTSMVRYRENVILLVVFASVPLLFISGVSWPQSNISWLWQSVSWLFPSTFGIQAFVRLNSMGAEAQDVMPQIWGLWLQTAFYLTSAYVIHYYRK